MSDPQLPTPTVTLSEILNTMQTLVSSQQSLSTRLERVERSLWQISQHETNTGSEVRKQGERIAELRADVVHLTLDDTCMPDVEDAIAEIGGMISGLQHGLVHVQGQVPFPFNDRPTTSSAAMPSGTYPAAILTSPDSPAIPVNNPAQPPDSAMSPAISTPSTLYRQAVGAFEASSEKDSSRSSSHALHERDVLSTDLNNLFGNVEEIANDFLTQPFHLNNARFHDAAAEVTHKPESIKGLMRYGQRTFLCCAVIDRILKEKVLCANIFANYDNPTAKQYTAKSQKSNEHRQSKPADVQGRGSNCSELARLACSVITKPGFAAYLTGEASRVHEFLLGTVDTLIPMAQYNKAKVALAEVVNEAFRIAFRMHTATYEYSVCFPFLYSILDTDDSIIRNKPQPDTNNGMFVVRMSISPIIMQKKFGDNITATTVHKGHVLVISKRTNRGKSWKSIQQKKKSSGTNAI